MSQKQETPYDNNLFSNHFLENRVQDLDEWQEAEIKEKFDELQQKYELHKPILDGLGEEETKNKIIGDFFKMLGHSFVGEQTKRVSGKLLKPDYLMIDDEEKEAQIRQDEDRTLFDEAYAVADAKKWDTKLDRSSSDHTNPAFQIYNYVDRLRINWGILTNGKKWRLYAYEDAEADTYYEIDIVEQIFEKDREEALENFKYFYLFFRQESFLPREEGFVDKVFKGSVSYAKGLEEDLEDDIYDALEITAQGFFETNDIEMTEENIEEVHHSSLILLYRLLFVLNAESRDLLPADNDRYEKKLSLKYLTERLDEEDSGVFSDDSWAWDERVNDLFDAIDNGREYGDKFKITAYNGGLFDQEEHDFLANHKLKGTHIKKILKKLAQSEDEETEETVLVDYRDLNIRHLGSVYEGLLEHELAEAKEDMIVEDGEWEPAEDSKKDFDEVDETDRVKEGQVYITNESGERKATGSYYTPEYIVEYIVENTVGPKVEEKIEEAEDESEVLDKVLELNICDPAMGSGHFLTEATSFIARKVIENGKLEEEDIEEGNEFVWVKRQAVKESIYGVDINPLAVELGKLSLWIETMARGKPLSFLDHHLKVGNSLVGSDFDNIFSHPTEKQKKIDNDRFKFGTPEDLKQQFKKEYQKIEEKPEETKEEVHEKEKAYEDFKKSTLYRQVKQLANVHTRQFFDEEADSSDYEGFLVNMGAEGTIIEEEDWFKSAQSHAKNMNYFHWKIEFPKIFFGETKGFDAVVGNPPYIRSITLKQADKETWAYLKESYETASHKEFDIYACFLEKGNNITDGLLGYILPNKFFTAQFAKPMRELLVSNNLVKEILDFNAYQIFDDVTTYTCVLTLGKGQDEIEMKRYDGDLKESLETLDFNRDSWDVGTIDYSELSSEPWDLTVGIKKEVLSKIDPLEPLGNYGRVWKGTGTNADDVFIVDKLQEREDVIEVYSHETEEKHILEKELLNKCVKGKDIKQNRVKNKKRLLITPYEGENNQKLIEPQKMKKKFPKTYDYFLENRDILEEREQGRFKGPKFYCFGRPQNMDKMDRDKLLLPAIVNQGTSNYDEDDYWVIDSAYFFIPEDDISLRYTSSLLNSPMMSFFLKNTSTKMRGGYYSMKSAYSEPFPIPDPSEISQEKKRDLENLNSEVSRLKDNFYNTNTQIRDYLGNYKEGNTLNDLYTPISGISDKPISETSADKEKLQVGSIRTERNDSNVTILVSARYKPENESAYDTDRYGYTETELFPAMEFHNLSEAEATLIEEFVPVAVDEAGGFANFRKKATKTNSLVDRLKKLTLPKVSDVEDDLEKFMEQKERAEELDQKIEETEEEINEIVYNLYDLTDEEIEVVEEAVDGR